MHHFLELTRKLSSCASVQTLKKDHYLNNGSAVLEELIALCDGKSRIPLRYLSTLEIERATRHSEKRLFIGGRYMVKGLLDKRLVLVSFKYSSIRNSNYICRDIAINCQMSHLKNVLKLVGCCLEYAEPVMVYEYVEAITLSDLLFNDHARKSLSWGNRLRIANQVASAVVYLHSEFTTPIVYVDLHSQKVLIDQSSGSIAKLFDFSFSISLPAGELEVEAPGGVRGTSGYADPEYVRSGIVTEKTDVFGYGVILFQLLTAGRKGYIVDGEMTHLNKHNEHVVSNIIKECNVMDIVDPVILEGHGTEIQQQLEDYLDLVKKCTLSKGDDRPYMIHVAKELHRIEKCFRTLTLGVN